MVKKVKMISIFAILAVIILSIASIFVVEKTTVNDIQKFQLIEEKDFYGLKWNSVSGATGYNIYCLNDGKYKKIDQIGSNSSPQYKLDGLNPITKYDFKVSAYKVFVGKTYEGNKSATVDLMTNPNATDFSFACSSVRGIASFEWNKEDGSGYELQYTKDEFNDEQTDVIIIDNSGTTSYDIENLELKTDYSFRIRTYFISNGKTHFSPWSKTSTITIKDADSKVDPSKPVVALTFDDGPNYSSTKRILDILEKYDARATFFMVGNRITGDNKKLVKREVKMGCELGNHTYAHTHYGSKVTASDITKCSNVIKKVSGSYPTAFRCPGGTITNVIRENSKAPIFYWSVDTEDWKTRNAKKTYKRVMSQVKDGDIILMHDIYGTTADAVEKIVPALVKKGYQLVTVSELFEAKGITIKDGHQYYSTTSKYNEYK